MQLLMVITYRSTDIFNYNISYDRHTHYICMFMHEHDYENNKQTMNYIVHVYKLHLTLNNCVIMSDRSSTTYCKLFPRDNTMINYY